MIFVKHTFFFISKKAPAGENLRGMKSLSLSLSFNGNVLILFYLWCIYLRYGQFQDTIFKFCMNIFFRNILANIEASADRAGITFLTDVFAVFVFLFFRVIIGCADCQISILQFSLNIFFLISRKINIKFITFVIFLDICLSIFFQKNNI